MSQDEDERPKVSQMLRCHKAFLYFSTLSFKTKGKSFMQSLIKKNKTRKQNQKYKGNKGYTENMIQEKRKKEYKERV